MDVDIHSVLAHMEAKIGAQARENAVLRAQLDVYRAHECPTSTREEAVPQG